jgi:hypothetical protein
VAREPRLGDYEEQLRRLEPAALKGVLLLRRRALHPRATAGGRPRWRADAGGSPPATRSRASACRRASTSECTAFILCHTRLLSRRA